MLKEVETVRQEPGQPVKRWFTDEYFDLFVWQQGEEIVHFQLCYEKPREERVLSWRKAGGFQHDAVDDGEQRDGRHKASPIFVDDGAFDRDAIGDRLREAGAEVDAAVIDFVLERIAGG
ncbi:MAG: hypothetical protein JXR96_02150 [Deltaproteobacteria bacterium]|nr:hypothetical protein [Deltaproteobacteria bacterium]